MSYLGKPSRLRHGLRPALFAALTLAAPAAALATQFGPINATRTTAVHFVNSSTTPTTGVVINGSVGNVKVAYLTFKVSGLRQHDPDVPYPHTLFRRVTKAELKLTLNADATGKNLQVWSSHNYTGSFSPATTGLVALENRSMPAGLAQTIDVTDYISGEGVFSFCIKTSSAANIAFNASPVLALTLNDGKDTPGAVTYDPEDYNDLGGPIRERYSAKWGDINDAGIIDITKQPYNAVPNDDQDDLLAIQRAVNDAQRARVAVFIPNGEFTISDTLNCETPRIPDGWIDPGEVSGDIDSEFHSRQDFPTVIRGVIGGTSTIKLVPGTGFGSTTLRKPALYFWSRHREDAKTHLNVHASNFNHTLMHVTVDVSDVTAGATNNNGAVGVSMPGSQGIRLSDVTIKAGGAFAGVIGMPGAGGIIHNLKVYGGQYGIWSGTSSTSESHTGYTTLINYSVFDGQAQQGLLYGGGCSVTVVGTKFINNKGIHLDAGTRAWNGPLSMVDSSISLSGAASNAAITGTRSVYLKNVYMVRGDAADTIKIVSVAAPSTAAANLGNKGEITFVDEFAGAVNIDQAPFHTGGATQVPIFVKANDIDMTAVSGSNVWPAGAGTAVGALPGDFFYSKHNWIPTPDFRGGGAFNVGAGEDGINAQDLADDWTKLDAAVRAHPVVFLPAGTYYLSKPLVLPAGCKIFGISKSYTIIKPLWNNFAGGALQPLIRTADAAGDRTLIADIQLRTRISANSDLNVYQLHWRSGDGVVKDLLFDRRQMYREKDEFAHPLILIDSNGGGQWYNFWINRDFAATGYRHMKISSTSQALAFYMFNPEYAKVTCQVEVLNSRNIDFYAVKTEGNYRNITFTNTDKFRVYGLGGNASPWPRTKRWSDSFNIYIKNCQDYMLSNQAFQQREPAASPPYYQDDNDGAYNDHDGAKTDPANFDRLLEQTAADATIGRTPGTEQFVLYRRGSPFTP